MKSEEPSPVPATVVKDFVGNVIRPGDTVVYPVRRGSSLWMNMIEVTLVREDSLTGHNKLGRVIHITNLSNVVVVTLPKPETTNASV